MVAFILCRTLLAATFLLSASGKFFSGNDAFRNALALSVPRPLARVGEAFVIPLEFMTAAVLLFGNRQTFEVGLAAAAVLVSVFTGWMVSVLLRDLQLQCSCFGPRGAAVGWPQVGRNILLLTCAAVGLLIAPTGHDAVGGSVWSGLVLGVGALLLVLAVGLRRAIPSLVLSLEQMREAVAGAGEGANAR